MVKDSIYKIDTNKEEFNRLNNIPDELKELKHWVVYNEEKKPHNPLTGKPAKTNDQTTWESFENCVKAYIENTNKYKGIGFVFLNSGYFGVDVDANYLDEEKKIKDPTLFNNAIQEFFIDKKIKTQNRFTDALLLKTYCEVSYSKTGLHLIFKGELPTRDGKGYNQETEYYQNSRFFTFTGNVVSDDHKEITYGTELIKPYIEKYKGNDDNTTDEIELKSLDDLKDLPYKETGNRYSVSELFKFALNSKNKEHAQKMNDLFVYGKWEKYYTGISECVQGMINYCGYYANYDFDKALELFKKSVFYQNIGDLNFNKSETYIQKWARSIPRYEWKNTVSRARKEYLENKKTGFGFDLGYFKKELISLDDIKKALVSLGNDKRKYLSSLQENPNKSIKLSPETIANTMYEMCNFILIKSQNIDEDRLVLYNPDTGMYSVELSTIKALIYLVEPSISSQGSREVIEKIRHKLVLDNVRKPACKDKYLTLVGNGIFNKKTKALEPFNPDIVFTNRIVTNYVEDAKEPTFKDGWTFSNFLKDISNNDPMKINLLWQVIAKACSPNWNIKKAFFFFSELPSTGKSTLINFIQGVIGEEYTTNSTLEQLSSRFGLSNILNKTLLVSHENEPKTFISSTSNLKTIISGDSVTVERKGENTFDYTPNLTVIQAMNNLPRFNAIDEAMLSRMIFIRFNHQYKKEEQNPDVKGEYPHNRQLREYILCKALNTDFTNIIELDESKEILKDLETKSDNVRSFLNEYLEKTTLEKIPCSFLFEVYLLWAEHVEHCNTKLTRHTFSSKVNLCSNEFQGWEFKKARIPWKSNNDKPDYKDFIETEINNLKNIGIPGVTLDGRRIAYYLTDAMESIFLDNDSNHNCLVKAE